MELPPALARFAPAAPTMGRPNSTSFSQSPGNGPFGPLRTHVGHTHTPPVLPFPYMRPGILQSAHTQPIGTVPPASNPTLGLSVLNLLNKSPLLASLHYQQQKQAISQAMPVSSKAASQNNSPSAMDIYQLVSMARDSLKPKEIVRHLSIFK